MTIEKEIVSALSGIVGIQQYLVGLPERETVAQQILKSSQYRAFAENKSDMASVELKAAITSTGAVNDPLVPSFKPQIDAGVRRALNLRDLIPSFPTINGAIELPRKSAATNNAGPQRAGSPLERENLTKPESAYTFENVFSPVQTFAHFVPVSSQIFEDSGQLQAFIEGELAHGLAVAIESAILNGDGTTGTLDGLLANATAYALRSPQVSGAKAIRDALRQVAAADFTPSAIVLNPDDWYDIDAALDTAGANRLIEAPRLWGLPVVESNAIAAGTFLCGDFRNAGALFVRDAAKVEIARHDSTNFQAGRVTIRAEERLALVPTNALALVKGSL